MTEIEKFKYLLDRGTFHFKPFFSDEIVEAMPDITSLLTTIESQKETIDEQYHTISTSNIWNSKLKDEIESLKAITELAVKSLKDIRFCANKSVFAQIEGAQAFRGHIHSFSDRAISEIEKLQK